MSAPLGSVIMQAHNAQAFVGQSIQSVVNQTFPDWELIVANDASTDTTQSVIDAFRSDPRIRSVRLEASRGVAGARNAAIAESRGRYLAFLDADDTWDPTKLQRQIAFAEATRAP